MRLITTTRARTSVVLALSISLVGMAADAVPAAAGDRHIGAATSDADVVHEWMAIAARTIYTENLTPIPPSPLYFGFMSLAVYDAVVTVEGGYEPYLRQPSARGHASADAAAATAAYRVLKHYFPASATALRADYVAALAEVPDGVGQRRGIRVGRVAANRIIRLREDDGRGDTSVPQPGGLEPGVWRPTPPASLPMLAPWLGFVTPLMVESQTGWLPGPDPLDSAAYADDFLEAKQYGARDGSLRSAEQTATAHFWNTNSPLKFQQALGERVRRAGFDLVATARAFAILNAGTADSVIACWRGKYDFEYWRPITAIRLADTDDNPATEPDPEWASLFDAPPYPDYPSGHACITGAFSQTVSHLFGADSIDVTVPSLATTPARHFATAEALDRETENGRIWLGIHFRKAMTDGTQLGHDVTEYGITHNFQPTG